MQPNQTEAIALRFQRVADKIATAATKAGRRTDEIKLVTVTKTHPLETILAAYEAGVRDFGENYPEEAAGKIELIGDKKEITWHMIGHVQSRKAEIVARDFQYLHSLDSLKLATRLSRCAVEFAHYLPVLIEANVGGEESKFGYPASDKESWPKLADELQSIAALPNLEIRGLMTMPPFNLDGNQTRPYFSRLRELMEYLSGQVSSLKLKELSMGTSTDFEIAVEEGATMVRVGTAILGARPFRNP